MTDRETTRRLLEDLVDAYSPSGREDEAAEVLVGHLEKLGLEAYRDDVGNVHAWRASGDRDEPTVRLLGHVDTVPGRLPVGWTDGELTGRGAVDAKGPLVAHALALARLPEDLPVHVHLVAAVGEETDSRGARHLVDTIGPPDALVIGEPTGPATIGLGYKGRLHGQLVATASPAHAGAPESTAPERLLDAVDELTRWTDNDERDVGFDETTLRVTDLESEQGPERSTARAGIDLRVPGEVPSPGRLAKRLPSGVELEVVEAVPAVRAPAGNPVAIALRGALIETGLDPRPVVKTGTSDWNVVGQAWECPTVAYGPGDPSLDHTPDEAIALQDVVEASRVLAKAIRRWADRQENG